jgi:hypothetical protein
MRRLFIGAAIVIGVAILFFGAIGVVALLNFVTNSQVKPISAEGCGVIATVIPVLLLAGLFDGSFLRTVIRPPSGMPESRAGKVLRRIGYPLYGYMALSILAGLAFACVGVADDGISAEQRTEATLVWLALGSSTFYVILGVATRIMAAGRDEQSIQDVRDQLVRLNGEVQKLREKLGHSHPANSPSRRAVSMLARSWRRLWS